MQTNRPPITRRWYSSLRVKLLTSYIAIFMVILLFSYIFMFNIFRDVIVENYRVSTYNDSLRAANNVIRYIDEVNNCIRLFASSDSVQDLNATDMMYYEKRLELYNRFLNDSSRYLRIYKDIDPLFVYTNTGYLFGTSILRNWNLIPDDVSSNRIFKDLAYAYQNRRQRYLCIGAIGLEAFIEDDAAEKDQHYISVVRQYNAANGESGIIVANINEAVINSIMNNIIKDYNKLYIFNDKGIIISDSDSGQIGKSSSIYEQLRKMDSKQVYGDFIRNFYV